MRGTPVIGKYPVSYTHLDVYKRQVYIEGGDTAGMALFQCVCQVLPETGQIVCSGELIVIGEIDQVSVAFLNHVVTVKQQEQNQPQDSGKGHSHYPDDPVYRTAALLSGAHAEQVPAVEPDWLQQELVSDALVLKGGENSLLLIQRIFNIFQMCIRDRVMEILASCDDDSTAPVMVKRIEEVFEDMCGPLPEFSQIKREYNDLRCV